MGLSKGNNLDDMGQSWKPVNIRSHFSNIFFYSTSVVVPHLSMNHLKIQSVRNDYRYVHQNGKPSSIVEISK